MKNTGLVNLAVFDVLGRKVTTLVNEVKNAGLYEAEIDARNLKGGIYFYRMNTGNFSGSQDFIVVK